MLWLKKLLGTNKANYRHQFETSLGDNLHSLIQYGSSVRKSNVGKDDINLLIVLKRSTPEAHAAIHQIISDNPTIEPFVLGIRGFEHTVKSFAVKFLSISRNYKLLSGQDVLSDIHISVEHEKFLAEQALRNLRLKLIHCFAKHGPSKTYVRFANSLTTSFMIDISEVLRCEELEVPTSHLDRVKAFSDKFDFDLSVLDTLLSFKRNRPNLDKDQIELLHRNLFILLDNVILYIESQWHE